MTAMAMRNAMVRAMRMARSMVAVFLRISRLRLAFSDSCSSDRTEVSGSSSSGRVDQDYRGREQTVFRSHILCKCRW